MTIKLLIFGLLISYGTFSVDTSYHLDDIQFEINSSRLTDDRIRELEIIISSIRKASAEGGNREKFTLWINGNADFSENSVNRLSNERAEIVKDQLIELGLTEGKLIAKGNGSKRPLANSSSDAAKRRNARVDFKIRFE